MPAKKMTPPAPAKRAVPKPGPVQAAKPTAKAAPPQPKPQPKPAPTRPVARAPEPEPVQLPIPGGKLGQMVTLLRRSQGATIADLTKATGWQKHSVRGAIAGELKKRGFEVTSDKPGEVRIYRIAPPPAVAAARSKLARKGQ